MLGPLPRAQSHKQALGLEVKKGGYLGDEELRLWVWVGEHGPGRRSDRDSPVLRAGRVRELEKEDQGGREVSCCPQGEGGGDHLIGDGPRQ